MDVRMSEDEANAYLEGIVNEATVEVTSVKEIEGGVEIDVSLEQAEREAGQIFIIEHEMEDTYLSDEDNSTSYALLGEGVDDDGNVVLVAGTQSLPEYSDDETDGYFHGTVYVVKAHAAETARAKAAERYQRLLGDAALSQLDNVASLIEKGGAPVAASLRGNVALARILRAAATTV